MARITFRHPASQLRPKPVAASSAPAKASQLHAASASVTVSRPQALPDPKPIAAPGTEIYTAKRGEAIPTIARRYLGKTSYLTSSELADAIRSVNHKSDSSNILKANEEHRHPRNPLRARYRKDRCPFPKTLRSAPSI